MRHLRVRCGDQPLAWEEREVHSPHHPLPAAEVSPRRSVRRVRGECSRVTITPSNELRTRVSHVYGTRRESWARVFTEGRSAAGEGHAYQIMAPPASIG